jgi:Mrp family chromosome partitioning ATPase
LAGSLLLASDTGSSVVIAVAGASHDEGSGRLAQQLALVLAKNGSGSALVITQETGGKKKGAAVAPGGDVTGLARLLVDRSITARELTRQGAEGVDLLAYGESGFFSGLRIVSLRSEFERVLHEFRNEYRFVVVNAPPLLASADSSVVVQASDAVVLCAQRDVSSLWRVRSALRLSQQLTTGPVKLAITAKASRRKRFVRLSANS